MMMNKRVEDQFDDPALKQAIKRAWPSGENAPPGLRARIEAAMSAASLPEEEMTTTATAGTTTVRRTAADGSHFWKRPLSPWAAAAAILVALIGGGVWFYQGVFAPKTSNEPAALRLSDNLVAAMIDTHDQLASQSIFDASVPGPDNISALRKSMMDKVHRPVWVSDLRRAGWQYKGATVATVDGKPASEIVFGKDDATMSMVSLPAPNMSDAYMQDYDVSKSGHNVVGFAAGRMLFCLVESSPKGTVNLDEVRKIRDEYRGDALAMLNVGGGAGH